MKLNERMNTINQLQLSVIYNTMHMKHHRKALTKTLNEMVNESYLYLEEVIKQTVNHEIQCVLFPFQFTRSNDYLRTFDLVDNMKENYDKDDAIRLGWDEVGGQTIMIYSLRLTPDGKAKYFSAFSASLYNKLEELTTTDEKIDYIKSLNPKVYL